MVVGFCKPDRFILGALSRASPKRRFFVSSSIMTVGTNQDHDLRISLGSCSKKVMYQNAKTTSTTSVPAPVQPYLSSAIYFIQT